MRININRNNLLDIINIKFDVFNPINSFMSKENIISLFEDSKFRNFTITNIVIFDKDVIIDININNPTLQARKKTESSITGLISQKFGEKINLKINTRIEKSVNDSNQIKGKPIPGINNVIAIASGKGGVGKSTVTSNIAVSLNSMGFSVGILDADIYGPSIPIMFDVENSRPLSVTIDGKNKMSPVESYGIKILSIGFFTKSDQAVIWRGPMATKALNQMIFDAAWGNLDFLLIDLPPGTGDIHLSILQALPVTGSVIVSTPQNIALSDARKGVAMFNQKSINVPVLGIIENMSYFTPEELPKNKYYIFGKDGAKNLAIDLDVPYLGEVPIIQSIREASDYGHPASLQKESVISDLINLKLLYFKLTVNSLSTILFLTIPSSDSLENFKLIS